MSARAFPLGVVLSVTQDRLAADFGEVQEFVEYLLGEPVWTLGVGAAIPACREHIVEHIPALKGVEMPDDVAAGGESMVRAWVAVLEGMFGNDAEVPPLPPGTYSAGGFVGELRRFVEGKR